MTGEEWWGSGWVELEQILPPIRDGIFFCPNCEAAYFEGEDCCYEDEPIRFAERGFGFDDGTVTVAQAMEGNTNLGERK